MVFMSLACCDRLSTSSSTMYTELTPQRVKRSQRTIAHGDARHTDSRAPDADGLRPTEPETADTRVVPYPMRSYGLDPGTRGAGGIRTRDPSSVKLAVNIHTPPEPEASGPATRAGIAIGPRQPAAAPAGCRRGAVYSCSRVGASA